MKRRWRLGVVCFLAASAAFGGNGVWTKNGPPGGSRHVVADPGLPGVVYTENARSTDNGLSWTPNGPPSYIPDQVAVGTAGKVYSAGTLGAAAVMLSSDDAGIHWTVVQSRPTDPVTTRGFDSLYADPRNPLVVYARFFQQTRFQLPESEFEKSSDGGYSWGSAGAPVDTSFRVSSLAINPSNTSVLLASVTFFPPTSLASYRTADGGATWSAISTAEPLSRFVFDPHSPSTAYAVGYSGVSKSSDGGVTFSPVDWSLTSITELVISPTRSGRFFALVSSGVYESSDNGSTWTSISEGLPAGSVYDLTVDSTGTFLHVAASGFGGVYDYELTDSLVLNSSHPFSVSLTATDQRTGRTGSGVATQMNDLWGYFSLPAITGNPNNPEVFVKMLDGTAINGLYWFFYGGLTDLEYTLTVREDATGLTRTYTKPAGSECGGSDTAAFGP